MFTSYNAHKATSEMPHKAKEAIVSPSAQLSKFPVGLLKLSAESNENAFAKSAVREEASPIIHEDAEPISKYGTEFMDTLCQQLKSSMSDINDNVHLLEDVNADLESLLLSEEGRAISPKLKDAILNQVQFQKAALSTIGVCAKHQKVVTEDALNLSNLESGNLELKLYPVNPKKIIKETIAMLSTAVKEKELEVYLNFAYEDALVNIDADRLRQVLLNLLSNAIKFTPKGGEIMVTMAKPEVNDTNTFVKFSVKDNGIGMTEEERERIFTPFAQANAQIAAEYGGSGLGLSISKRLVEFMGGKMDVESKKGKGTKFTFTVKSPNVLELQNKISSPLIFSNTPPASISSKASGLTKALESASFTPSHRKVPSLVG